MAFRTYDVDTLLAAMVEEMKDALEHLPPVEEALRILVADDLGVPAEDVFVENRDGEWVATVKMSPALQYITVTFDRPAPDAEEES